MPPPAPDMPPLPDMTEVHSIGSSPHRAISAEDVMSVVSDAGDEDVSMVEDIGSFAKGLEWRVTTSGCGLLKQIEQVHQKFACNISVMPPDAMLHDDR